MAVYRVTDAQLTALADAIRAKSGGEEALVFPQGFLQAVSALETGVSAEAPYAEYTVNAAGAVKRVKLFGFTSVPDYFFYGCTALEDVDWSQSPNLTHIGVRAFYGCTALRMTALPESLTTLAERAFESSTVALTALPESVTSIGPRAFSGCSSLAISALPANLTAISDYAFSNCGNITVSALPAGLTSIGTNAFASCKKITVSLLPAGVASVGALAFYGCTSIVNMEIAAEVLGTGTKIFQNCTGLQNVWIRSSCETITAASAAYSQFYGCAGALAIFAEPGSKPAGWGDYFNRTGTGGGTTAAVVWGQTARPW